MPKDRACKRFGLRAAPGRFHNYFTELALGQIPNRFCHRKFGTLNELDSGTEDIWDYASGMPAYEDYGGFAVTTAETVTLSSSSAEDTLTTGTGAWTVEIFGLDANYKLVNETISLAGLSASADSANTYLRVYRAIVRTAGTGATAAGDIYVAVKDANLSSGVPTVEDEVRAMITTGENQTQMCLYTVPADHVLLVHGIIASLDYASAGAAEVHLTARPEDQVFQVKTHMSVDSNGSNNATNYYAVPLLFTEKTDIKLQAEQINATGLKIHAEWFGELVRYN